MEGGGRTLKIAHTAMKRTLFHSRPLDSRQAVLHHPPSRRHPWSRPFDAAMFVGLVALVSAPGGKLILGQTPVQGRAAGTTQPAQPSGLVGGLAGARHLSSHPRAVPPSHPAGRKDSLRAVPSFGELPLSFEPDQGRGGNDARFVARGRGYSLDIGASEAAFLFGRPLAGDRGRNQQPLLPADRNRLYPSTGHVQWSSSTDHGPRAMDVLNINLLGANPRASAIPLEPLPGKANYFIGNDPTRWLTNVPTYARVKYQGVYRGVDLIYYGNQGGQLEYDFVVAPGADPGAIRLGLVREQESGKPKAASRRQKAEGRGQDQEDSAWLRIDRQGDLVVSLGGGEVRFRKPVVYQEESTVDRRSSKAKNSDTRSETGTAAILHSSLVTRHYVRGRFVIDRSRTVKFEVAGYDRSRPLVIDPSLAYSTYLGGSQADVGNGIAVDTKGEAYVAGQTCSADFPTLSAEQHSLAGQCDAFITKLDAAGTALVYSTYLGGSKGEAGSPAGNSAAGIAIDSAGDAYVTGITNASDFPTTKGSFQTTYQGGDSDAFVTKLSATGSALVYSTYLGGGDSDTGNAIAIDSSGDVFATGETYSNPFPTTPGAFQTAYGGRGDAFVTELNPTGTALVYSTYLGGELQDAGNGIAVDAEGSAFVTGSTYSEFFPVVHAIQENCGGYNPTVIPPCPLARDAFVTKFSSNGSSLVYSTYLGGSKDDVGTSVALDSLGAAYVAGFTTSIDFPARPDALQTALAGIQNAFVTKVDPLGGAPFAYSTYLGGSGVDAATAIAVDSNGIAYVTGGTSSSNFPVVSALQPNLAGPLVYPGDAFVSKMDAFGSGLIYSSFLGGGNEDVGNGIAVDGSLGVYVTGSTLSTDFPTAPNATSNPACPPTCPFQTAPAGQGDAFVSKFNALTSAVAEISPRNLVFPPQGLGIPSAPQTITVTNSGDATLLISSIVEVGDIYTPPPPATGGPPIPVDLKDWDVTTDNCTGILVAAGSNCTFTVTFVPNPTPYPNGLGPGQRTGTITLTDNATSPTQVINLSGQGVAPPAVTLLPTNLAFANQLSGTTSPPQTVRLSNSGGFVLAISSISVTPPFSETNTCGSSLGAGGNCTISVTFSPTTSGPVSGLLSFNDDASGSPQTVSLTGTGTAPVATLSTSSLAFTSQPVNTASSPQSITLTNSGTATLNISGITLTGANAADYSLTPASTCGGSVGAGASCTINVTFSPTAGGTRVAVVNISDNAQGSPQQVALSGVAILAPNVSLSATNLDFSPQNTGTSSTPQTVTLTNSGSADLEITASVATGNFTQTNNCLATVTAGATCTITVTFAPTAPGNLYGSVVITDNAANSPQTINLGGTGVAVPVATLSATGLSFSGQAVDTTSSPQSVTLNNTGTGALTIDSVALAGSDSGDFAFTSNCGDSLASGASCTVTVTFTPTAEGARTAQVNITDNSQGSPQSIVLSGNALATPLVTLSPASLTFASQNQGTVSPPQTITLTNTGTAVLDITNSVTTGDFAEINNCPPILAMGVRCSVTVTFTPTAIGNRYGALAITDNATGSPQSLPLSGVGVAAPVVSLSATNLTFTNQAPNTTSSAQSVILTNTGAANLVVSGISVSGANASDFALSQNCGASVAPAASCVISATFTPTQTGTEVAVINIKDDAPASPQTIVLAGTSVAAPVVTLSATSLTFAGQNQGTSSAPQMITVSNTGTAPLTITNSVASGDFAQTNNCSASIAAGASCLVTVTFTPTATGNRYGTIIITDNAVSVSQTILLAGLGLPGPVASLSATSLTFGGQNQGTVSAVQTVTLTNTGTGPLNITNSAPSGDFVETNNCPTTLAVGANCAISVSFTPSAVPPPTPGNQYGSVTLTDNAANSPQTILLSGLVVAAPVATLSASNLAYGVQSVGTASSPQPVTLTNAGSATLNIASIALSSPNFTEINACPNSLTSGNSCTINITFLPSAGGTQTATLSITDNTASSPQTVTIAGTGADFSISATPSSATVASGGTTTYTVTVTPQNGFTGTVAFSCSNLPSSASCVFSPTSLTEKGAGPMTTTVTVNTASGSSALPRREPPARPHFGMRLPLPWLIALILLSTLLAAGTSRGRRARARLALAGILLFLLGWMAACGGGGNGSISGAYDPSGAASGTYKITLSGTSGTVVHSATVTLTVQ